MAPPEPKARPSEVQVEQQAAQQYYSNGSVAVATSPVAVLNYILRFAAVALTLTAAIVMGVGKQTENVDFGDGNGAVAFTIKTISLSTFKYFVAANAIASAYSMASLVLSILSRGASRNLGVVLALADLVMVALLFSGGGAASAITVLAKDGAGVVWGTVCDVYGKLCDYMRASIVLSMIAALVYILLVVFFVVSTRK